MYFHKIVKVVILLKVWATISKRILSPSLSPYLSYWWEWSVSNNLTSVHFWLRNLQIKIVFHLYINLQFLMNSSQLKESICTYLTQFGGRYMLYILYKFVTMWFNALLHQARRISINQHQPNCQNIFSLLFTLFRSSSTVSSSYHYFLSWLVSVAIRNNSDLQPYHAEVFETDS